MKHEICQTNCPGNNSTFRSSAFGIKCFIIIIWCTF